jgi:hypothetical protein
MRAVFSIVKSCSDRNARDKQDNPQHMSENPETDVKAFSRSNPFSSLPADATRAKIHNHIESVKTTMAVVALSGAFWQPTVSSCTARLAGHPEDGDRRWVTG